MAAAVIRPDGWTARELKRTDARYFARQQLLIELGAHREALAAKAGVELAEWHDRIRALQESVTWIPTSELLRHGAHPDVRAVARVDADDAIYVACALAADAILLWTRDRAILRTLPDLAKAVVPTG